MSAAIDIVRPPPPPLRAPHPGRRAAAKYLAVARVAARQALGEGSVIAGRMLFYGILLLVFAQLWDVALAGGLALGALSRVELVWHLAITEWTVLTVPLLHLEIERDVRSGDIAYRLARPMSYLGARLAEAGGEWVLRAAAMAVAGIALAWTFGGGWPADPRGLLFVLPLGVLSFALMLLWLAAIGLLAFGLQDCSPAYWLWQKTAFVLGGLMLPLEIYPGWLQGLAAWTPFAPMMHGVGRMAFGWDPGLTGEVALRLLFWIAVTAGLVAWLQRRALRALDVNGG